MYINIYTKKRFSTVVQIYKSYSLLSLSSLVCVDQLVTRSNIFFGIFREFSWKQFHSENKRLSLVYHIALQGFGINFL